MRDQLSDAQTFKFEWQIRDVLWLIISLGIGLTLCTAGVSVALLPGFENAGNLALMKSLMGLMLFLGGLLVAGSGPNLKTSQR